MNEEDPNPRLENALRELGKDRVFVPPDQEKAIIKAINEHFKGKQEDTISGGTLEENHAINARPGIPARRKQKYWHKWMPLAASLAIAVIILHFSRPIPDRADINRDGTVNVVDALLLAEQIQAGQGRDINGDGSITEADATEIAARAVDLERSGS
jgi:hypothetical protein